MQREEQLQTIGKYEVVGSLGRGSMGVVYKARDPEIGRLVAVKTLRKIGASQFQSWDQALERFKIEARSAGNLRHPNLITIFEVNRDRDTPFIVMDYVEGEGLDSLISRQRKLDPQATIGYLAQAAEGLDYAHAQGVVHRDIKPSNIIVDKQGRVFILDFGVATISGRLGQGDTSAGSGLIMGSPGYMSPEQILNDPALDARSDLFALAVVAFECFTGQRPFPGENFTAVVGNILESRPLSLTSLVPELPLSLESAFERALAKRRDERFASAREMVSAFAHALGLQSGATSAAPTSLPAVKSRRRTTSRWNVFRSSSPSSAESAARAGPAKGAPPADRTPLFKVDITSGIRDEGGWGAARPGDLFKTRDSSPDLQRYGQSRSSSPRLLLGLVLLVAGGGGLYYLSGGFDAPPPADPSAEAAPPPPPGNETIPSVSIEHINISGSAPAPGPESSTAQEMTDKQLIGTISAASSTDARRLEALREARRRNVTGLFEVTLPLLQADSYVIRIEAAKALGEIGDKRAAPALLAAMDDIDPVVREHVVKSLSVLGDRASLGYLNARLLKEEDPGVKAAIKSAIAKISGIGR